MVIRYEGVSNVSSSGALGQRPLRFPLQPIRAIRPFVFSNARRVHLAAADHTQASDNIHGGLDGRGDAWDAPVTFLRVIRDVVPPVLIYCAWVDEVFV